MKLCHINRSGPVFLRDSVQLSSFFALIKSASASFQTSVKTTVCMRQFVLQVGSNAILYGYTAVCLLSWDKKMIFAVLKF